MKKIPILLSCCAILLLLACEKPENHIIEQEKMVNILVDVHLIEASLLGYSEEQKDTLTELYYNQIYEIHAVTENDFLEEMDYLKKNPEKLKELYEKVLEEIDKREAELK